MWEFFHFTKGVSFPCKFKATWSMKTPKIIVLTFAVSLFHWASSYASYSVGFKISVCVYPHTLLSSRTTSILCFQEQKFEVPSSAYSSLNLLKAAFPALKRIYTKNYENQNFSERRYGTRFLCRLLMLWYHVESVGNFLLLMKSN